MTKIKPCPCCNGGVACSTGHATAGMRKARLRCDECGLEIVKVGVSDSDAILKAAQAWNARWERTCRLVRHDGCKSHGWWTCSECGARINGHPLSNPDKYCGRCGAKVVSE